MYKSKEELLNAVYDKGFEYEKKYSGCAQGTIAALQDIIDGIDNSVFKAATLCGGGICSQGKGICGGLAGGLMVIGYLIGRDRDNYGKRTSPVSAIGRELTAKFFSEYESFICHDIQKKTFGRSFDLTNMEDRELFEKMGAHETKCPNIVAKAAQWTLEILLDKGVVVLKDGEVFIDNKKQFIV